MNENPIYAYYQQIQDGTVNVGKWVRLIYEKIIQGLEAGLYFYSHKKTKAAILFIEQFCHHHEGHLAPGRVKLELWQKATLAVIFGILDADGLRQFREVFLVVARKNGKTLFAAAIAEYCTFLDGEYGGRIYFAAPKLEQAALCFEAYHQMILQEPELDAMAQKRRTDIYIAQNNTTAKPLAFSAKKSDGLNISLAIADEIASWQGDQGLKFYEVIKSSFGARRQPLLLAMSTAGYVNDGIFDELMKRSTRFLLGESKETRLLPILYMIDDIDKWNDINELRKSIPNLGVSVSVDYMLEEIEIASEMIHDEAHPDATIIWGAAFDPALVDEIKVTIIATGFIDNKNRVNAPEAVERPVFKTPEVTEAPAVKVQPAIEHVQVEEPVVISTPVVNEVTTPTVTATTVSAPESNPIKDDLKKGDDILSFMGQYDEDFVFLKKNKR